MKQARLWLDEEIRNFIHTGDGNSCFAGQACRPLGEENASSVAPSPLSRPRLDRFIAESLKKSLGHMARRSLFYKHKLAGFQDAVSAIVSCPAGLTELLQLLEALPFTTPQELASHSECFLSIGQSQVAGLISIPTSGTSGERKRIFCSQTDLERTIRFFEYGMRLLLPQLQGQKVLLLMSGEREGSVGHLLQEGLGRWPVPCDVYGFPMDMVHCLNHINRTRPSCIVALPSHLMTLCRMGFSPHALRELKVVLLSGEWASPTIKNALEEQLGCPVYLHYGLTESGLAGAVECSERAGCHIREADMLLSIADAEGRPLGDGEWGEVILTTLTRQATPLLRYKTGDWGRIVPGPCACGSVLKRLEAGERMLHRLRLPSGRELGFAELDAALFPLSWLAGYSLTEQEDNAGQGAVRCAHGEEAETQAAELMKAVKPKKPAEPRKTSARHPAPPPMTLALHLDCTENFTARHEMLVTEALNAIPEFQASGGRSEETFVENRDAETQGRLKIVLVPRVLAGISEEGIAKTSNAPCKDCRFTSTAHKNEGNGEDNLSQKEPQLLCHLKDMAQKILNDPHERDALDKGEDLNGENALHELDGLERALAAARTVPRRQVTSGKRRMPHLPS